MLQHFVLDRKSDLVIKPFRVNNYLNGIDVSFKNSRITRETKSYVKTNNFRSFQ